MLDDLPGNLEAQIRDLEYALGNDGVCEGVPTIDLTPLYEQGPDRVRELLTDDLFGP